MDGETIFADDVRWWRNRRLTWTKHARRQARLRHIKLGDCITRCWHVIPDARQEDVYDVHATLDDGRIVTLIATPVTRRGSVMIALIITVIYKQVDYKDKAWTSRYGKRRYK